MAKKIRDEEPVTKDNIGPIMKEAFGKLISGYKQVLFEALDKLEKKQTSPGMAEIYKVVLDDVRQIIKLKVNSKKKDKRNDSRTN